MLLPAELAFLPSADFSKGRPRLCLSSGGPDSPAALLPAPPPSCSPCQALCISAFYPPPAPLRSRQFLSVPVNFRLSPQVSLPSLQHPFPSRPLPAVFIFPTLVPTSLFTSSAAPHIPVLSASSVARPGLSSLLKRFGGPGGPGSIEKGHQVSSDPSRQ